MIKNMKKRAAVISAALLVLVLSACAALGPKNSGSFRASREATAAFANYQIRPDYRYYYSGPEAIPNALIGIDRKYVLEPQDLWKPIEATPAGFKAIVREMKRKGLGEAERLLHGFDILDDKGNVIGQWYSVLNATTSVQMTGENSVLVYTPKMDVYENRRGALPRISPF
jgi:hypothetical protein